MMSLISSEMENKLRALLVEKHTVFERLLIVLAEYEQLMRDSRDLTDVQMNQHLCEINPRLETALIRAKECTQIDGAEDVFDDQTRDFARYSTIMYVPREITNLETARQMREYAEAHIARISRVQKQLIVRRALVSELVGQCFPACVQERLRVKRALQQNLATCCYNLTCTCGCELSLREKRSQLVQYFLEEKALLNYNANAMFAFVLHLMNKDDVHVFTQHITNMNTTPEQPPFDLRRDRRLQELRSNLGQIIGEPFKIVRTVLQKMYCSFGDMADNLNKDELLSKLRGNRIHFICLNHFQTEVVQVPCFNPRLRQMLLNVEKTVREKKEEKNEKNINYEELPEEPEVQFFRTKIGDLTVNFAESGEFAAGWIDL